MQLSKLTFSLASLIVIFALAFAVTPVMAETDGPTVRIEKYVGPADPATAADPTSNAPYVATRADFRVKLTFTHPVTAPLPASIEYRTSNARGSSVSAPTDLTTTLVPLLGATTTVYVATLPDLSTDLTLSTVTVTVKDSAIFGSTAANSKSNVGNSATFTLPPTIANAEASFGMPEAVPGQPAQYTVKIVFTNTATGTDNTADDLVPITTDSLTMDHIVLTDGYADIQVGLVAGTPGRVDAPATGDEAGTSTYTLVVTLRGTASVTLSLDPGYAMSAAMDAGGTVTIPTPIPAPAAPAVTPTATTDSITLTWTAATGVTYEYRQGSTGAFEDVTSPKTITGLTADTAYTFQVRVKQDGRTPSGSIATVTTSTNAAPGPDPVPGEITIPGTDTVPGGGYVVVVRDKGPTHIQDDDTLYVGDPDVSSQSINIQAWEDMPDLALLFHKPPGKGGAALYLTKSTNHTANNGNIDRGTVGITEIMWAVDEGYLFGVQRNIDHTREQWIEVHNTNSFDVKVVLGSYNATDHEVLTLSPPTPNPEIDRMSNFNVNNFWDVKGQSGNSTIGVDFVSMSRSKNGQVYTHGDNDGTNGGKWAESEYVYLRRIVDPEHRNSPHLKKLVYDFKGTPGRSNTISAPGVPIKTDIPNSPIIFNEIANRRNQENELEWIELKNVSAEARDLRNYEISLITAVGQENTLYLFPNVDNQVIMQPGEVLLLVDTDPRYNDDHPVAVGYNVRGGNDQALGLGDDAPRYVVTDFAGNGLPDDGEFVLVLRTSKDGGRGGDEGYPNAKGGQGNISDAVGYDSDLASTNHPLYTRLWPFKVRGAPHVHNKITPEAVHYRQHRIDPDEWTHGDKGPEHLALRDAYYTGVGYKRFATLRNPAHFGTPGYDHTDLIKTQTPHVGGGGVVTISEIMLDQGDGRYPQWIELYNSSDSPVNLHADAGWRLVIQNYDDANDAGVAASDAIPVGRLSGTLNFNTSEVKTILPQQTVIVASTRARNSGSAFFDTSVVFPPARVFSVYDDARGVLDVNHTTDPMLSTRGFYIELIDGKGNISDGVGNLVESPNRRVAAEIAWELSEITGEMMEDAPRSSILRRYREPKGGDSRKWEAYPADELLKMGIKAEGWVLASMTSFREVRQTWFGHQTDVGSPGITGGRVLPVSLSKFRPERLDDGTVVIRWITESELDNAGFNILRSETRTGEFTQINPKLIAGHGTTSERNTYEFTDTSAKPNVVYYYQIQDVSIDGEVQPLRITHLRGNVSAAGKLTTTWGELKLQD